MVHIEFRLMVQARLVANEIEFFDGGANVNTRLGLSGPTSISSLDVANFPMTVDHVYGIRSEEFVLDSVPAIMIRETDGNVTRTANRLGRTRVDATNMIIELCTPLKLFLQCAGHLTITCGDGQTEIVLDSAQQVRFGIRSRRQAPTETVTTTTDIRDIFEAISTFGSAMPLFAPKRSLPAIRGHPPLLEFSNVQAIPDGCEPPNTDIVVEAPATFLHAAMAAPLVYYLGATLRPVTAGRLLIGGDQVCELGEGRAFGRRSNQLIQHMVILDSAIMAERQFDILTHEREYIDTQTEFDWAALNALSIADRVREYLSVDTDLLESLLPKSYQTVYVTPTRRTIQSLPYLSFKLPCILPPHGTLADDRSGAIADGGMVAAQYDHADYRGAAGPPSEPPAHQSIGHRHPVGQHPAYPVAFRNRLHRQPESRDISITIVCNDSKMARESRLTSSIYRSRESSPISVDVHEGLARSELADAMQARSDYFHFIGHIEHDGFACSDGFLDASELTSVGPELFFLNSCDSFHQAIALIEAGSCAGIATRSRVPNLGATRVGTTIAEMLTRGYPIGISLELAQSSQTIAEKYTIVGDPHTDLTVTDSGIAVTCDLEAHGDGRFHVTLETHLTTSVGPGSLCTFHLGDQVPYHVHPTRQSFDVSHDDLLRLLELEEVPVAYDGEIQWSQDVVAELTR